METRATRLWCLAICLCLATVLTFRFPPYAVWDLPLAGRVVLALIASVVALVASAASRRLRRGDAEPGAAPETGRTAPPGGSYTIRGGRPR